MTEIKTSHIFLLLLISFATLHSSVCTLHSLSALGLELKSKVLASLLGYNHPSSHQNPMPASFYTTSASSTDVIQHRTVIHNGRVIAKLQYGLNTTPSSDFVDSFQQKPFLHECDLNIVEMRSKSKILKELRNRDEQRSQVLSVDFRTMLEIVQACEKLDELAKQVPPTTGGGGMLHPEGGGGYFHRNKTSSNSQQLLLSSLFSPLTMLKGIFPGTKWCGMNDIASNYHDLGEEYELDKCCRAHDHCPIKVTGFTTAYGVYNSHPFTKSHCECDEIFHQCLKRLPNRRVGRTMGIIFFNVLSMECTKATFPQKCVVRGSSDKVGRRGSIPPIPSHVPKIQARRINTEEEGGHSTSNTILSSSSNSSTCLHFIDDVSSPAKFVFASNPKWID